MVLDALEALKEHKRNGQVHNPSGFLVKAIKGQWKPTQSDNPTQYFPEFYEWYEKAISAGVVEDLPPHWLGRDSYNQPMVRVLPPIGQVPYTLMLWTEVKQMGLLPN